jgi:hypothetical protein
MLGHQKLVGPPQTVITCETGGTHTVRYLFLHFLMTKKQAEFVATSAAAIAALFNKLPVSATIQQQRSGNNNATALPFSFSVVRGLQPKTNIRSTYFYFV